MDENTKKKMLYLLEFCIYHTDLLIESVLEDSEDDPHHSAVTASNLVKCYIHVMEELGCELPYFTLEEYFMADPFLKDSFERFEKIRKKEEEYYHGEIF